MPILKNTKHERFAQELAKGKAAREAYVNAGYKFNDGNASTLKSNQKVLDRVAELQARAAERAKTTIEDIARQLDEDRDFAKDCKSASAAVAATMGKAKVLGLIIDKNEHAGPNGGPLQVTRIERTIIDPDHSNPAGVLTLTARQTV